MPLASFWSQCAWRPADDSPSHAYLREFVIRTKEQIESSRRRRQYVRGRREIRLKHKGGDVRARDRERNALRMKLDPHFKMACRIRQRLSVALRRQSGQKAFKTIEVIGCNIEELWTHLERQFMPGMTRDNYGRVWEVDHIRPCASFDLRLPEHQMECFHFRNLQPLFGEDNRRKNAKSPEAFAKLRKIYFAIETTVP